MDFTYHKKLSPIVGVVLALACVETMVLHIIAVAYWGWKVAILIGMIDLSLVVMLIQLIKSFRQYPVTLRDGVVTMRTGRRFCVPIALDDIAAFRTTWSADDLKARHVLNMALAAWPTTVFDLKKPLNRRGQSITTIAHCVDDPENFQRTIRQLIEFRAQEHTVA